MQIAKTKQTRKSMRETRAKTRRSTPPFSPLLMMGGSKDVFDWIVGDKGTLYESLKEETKTAINNLLKNYTIDKNQIKNNGHDMSDKDYTDLIFNIRPIISKTNNDKLKAYENATDIIYLENLKTDTLTELIKLIFLGELGKVNDNTIVQNISSVIKCIIYVTNNPETNESPTYSTSQPLFDQSVWTFVKDLKRENGGTDGKQNELDLVAAALWKQYVRQLEKQMNDEIGKPAATA